MAESVPADDGLDVSAVGDHLGALGITFSGPLTARLIAGGRSNLTYVMSDAEQAWVVRRPPEAGLTSSAHDMAREFRVTQALSRTQVPVPRPVALCEDLSVIGAPFTVVDFVQGRTIRTQDDLADLDDDEVAGCVEGLVASFADLHAIDHAAVGLGEFGRPDGYAGRQLRRWSGQWAQVRNDDSDGQAERLAAALAERIPAQRHASVVHGDFRIDNTLLGVTDPTKVEAIVDWELSTIGDPVADVALMCVYRHPALDLILGARAAWTSERLPDVDQLATAYEARSSIKLEHWEFHMALAYYKLAVIAQGIDHRFRAGATIGDGFDTAGAAVAELLAAGHDAIGASR
jgi:aminoglycoside phosphotransferase (APT) family kinase protein